MLSGLFWVSSVLCVRWVLVGVGGVRVGRYPMLKEVVYLECV